MMVMDYQLVLLSHFFGWHLRVVLFLRKGGDGEAERSDGRQDNSKLFMDFLRQAASRLVSLYAVLAPYIFVRTPSAAARRQDLMQ